LANWPEWLAPVVVCGKTFPFLEERKLACGLKQGHAGEHVAKGDGIQTSWWNEEQNPQNQQVTKEKEK
jgi:hypothetical protein